ncbi:hypothetical protein [Sediminitomix flava]|uniref:Uncharacterized protein n=1 Tax=Sediminitomix flava TaxID=379075 RepID=A0A315Z4Y4_SEDFL|nr:hypothetical protein [Sediminitomix flava]PWJ37933.1 hypothetical protein BC781_10868 [Sediminitomix flava]
MFFKTKIVKSRILSKPIIITTAILYIISSYYIFLTNEEDQNTSLKLFFLVIYFLGIYVLFIHRIIKPKKIGDFNLSTEKIEFIQNDTCTTLAAEDIISIELLYLGYGGWKTNTFWGNKNYIKISDRTGMKYDLEILIRNKSTKEELKTILNRYPYINKFSVKKGLNTRVKF